MVVKEKEISLFIPLCGFNFAPFLRIASSFVRMDLTCHTAINVDH